MTITPNDIKLKQSERLTDDEDGGGQMTGLDVIDGDINNLFDDITRIDRTYGEVSLRKAFLHVDTTNADNYLDAHAIISAQPADPKVTGLLFTTEDFYDERADAQQNIESFVIAGPLVGLHLRGTQLKNQKSIICYAPKINNTRAPEVGDTYVLRIDGNEATQQFIKVLAVTESTETFTYGVSGSTVNTFVASQYILQLSSELNKNYPADEPTPKPNNSTKIYSTQSSSSAKYYGSTTLAVAAAAGATSVVVADTFAPIIPTASNETPVIDQRPGGFIGQVVPTSPDTMTLTVSISPGSTSQLPVAIVPGSMSMTVSGTAYTDKGGIFVDSTSSTAALDGTAIDYRTGTINWEGTATDTNISLNFRPGVLRQQLPNTGKIEIDETNRSLNYVLSLDPKPAPTSFNASYQYLGKWYELQCDGSGSLVGDSGSGVINFDTGSVILSLQTEPDANSLIFFRWVEPSIFSEEVADAFSGTTPIRLQLSHTQIVAGSVEITWTTTGSVSQTATDTGGSGNITGHATGAIDYATGTILLSSASTPLGAWSVSYTHKDGSPLTNTVTVANNTDRSDITLATAANIEPGTVNFTIRKSLRREVRDAANVLISTSYQHLFRQMSDNGGGYIIDRLAGESVGTVNYSTGQIVISGTSFLKIRNV